MIIIRDNAVEVITVKMNLKDVIDKLILCYQYDDEERFTIEDKFRNFINNQSAELNSKIFEFIFKNKQVLENEQLFQFFKSLKIPV